MSYPLALRFKILAVARQLSVSGADGSLLMYAKRKAFKLFESIPILGVLSGYVFHPRYLISDPGGGPVVRVEKQAAFLESVFEVTRPPPSRQPTSGSAGGPGTESGNGRTTGAAGSALGCATSRRSLWRLR